jgi:hypothetical protein
MKNNYILSAIIFFSLAFISCKEEEPTAPNASVYIPENTLYRINESVTFEFTGKAQAVSVFTGDLNHDYDSISSGNTGFVVNKNKFSYAYQRPGTYKAVFVASNYNDGATSILSDTCSVTIRVIDDDTEIKTLTCPKVLYDEITANNTGNDWLVCLPQKILFSGKTGTISSKQRLSITVASDSSVIKVDGEPFSATKTYELKEPLSIQVTAHSGDIRDYTLYMQYYPEFETYKISGLTGTVQRSEFNYDIMTVDITVPDGTDVSSLIPEFTVLQGQEVYIGETLQVSGTSAVDFSAPVIYTLKNTVPGKNHLAAVTKITVKVTVPSS